MSWRSVYRVAPYQAGEFLEITLPNDESYRQRPPVLLYHARGGGAIFGAPGFGKRLVYEIAQEGFLCIGFDGGGTGLWGSPLSKTRAGQALTHAQSLGAKAGPALGFSYSMGGAGMMNHMFADQSLFLGGVTMMPVADIEYLHDNNPTYEPEIEAAYVDLAGWEAARPTHNPIEYIAQLDLPLRMYYASNDTAAITARQEALRDAAGDNFESVNLGAVTHTGIEAIPPKSIVRYLETLL